MSEDSIKIKIISERTIEYLTCGNNDTEQDVENILVENYPGEEFKVVRVCQHGSAEHYFQAYSNEVEFYEESDVDSNEEPTVDTDEAYSSGSEESIVDNDEGYFSGSEEPQRLRRVRRMNFD
ncbi:hypothetical protein IWW36_005661 [Coemansia brasiliensis]|uniref:Uncharacterized protein n=1 Tax=Coemansia brasiliensis TaxID=2650707 RepID=A0A9W8LWF5_9FUNG|nr:hypothetical protein IWW36_005661 [Coemansia brasiliensis]